MNIIFLFVSLFMLFFNWQRLIFVLISLEFIMLSLFLMLANYISEMMFFYFICFSVISSVLGILIMVGSIKTYGDDQCVF